ncbi:MAG: hypothetical protein KA253_01330 [Campylobacteraceae bacterium]|nr:hypothetical protein [Campylobacteraceae bacterium]
MPLTCKDFNLVIVIGTLLSRDDKARLADIQNCTQNGTKVVYLFSMEDKALLEHTTFFSRYEVGSEEGVLALLAKSLLSHQSLPSSIKAYFDDLDEGYVSAESNFGEEEIEEIEALYSASDKVLLILGRDLFAHPRAHNIARLAGLLSRFGKVTVDNKSVSDDGFLPDEIEALKSFDGVVTYACPALYSEEEGLLIGSSQFQMGAKVQDGEKVSVVINQEVYPRTFVLDSSLKGTIALMPKACENDTTYRYTVAKIVK